jgi:hypothetical protein
MTIVATNLLLSVGMLLFAIRVQSLFGRSLAGHAWRFFMVAASIATAVEVIALSVLSGLVVLPLWWREGGSLLFRATLVYAVYHFYKVWKLPAR